MAVLYIIPDFPNPNNHYSFLFNPVIHDSASTSDSLSTSLVFLKISVSLMHSARFLFRYYQRQVTILFQRKSDLMGPVSIIFISNNLFITVVQQVEICKH